MAKITSAGVVTASAGTAVRFTTAPTPIKSIFIQANKGNGGVVYVGDLTTSATTSPSFAAGESIEIKFKDSGEETSGDLSDFYMDSAVTGQGIKYIAVEL
jgi:hypothetical protein